MPKVLSANIKSVTYNESKEILTVSFHSGVTYTYSDVSKDDYDDMMKSKSPGKYFWENIRSSFKYKRKLKKNK